MLTPLIAIAALLLGAPAADALTERALSKRAFVNGDSLAVGMQPYLNQFLPGWTISVDARIGRPLAEGMSRLAAGAAQSKQTVYAFSLFTNDDANAERHQSAGEEHGAERAIGLAAGRLPMRDEEPGQNAYQGRAPAGQ